MKRAKQWLAGFLVLAMLTALNVMPPLTAKAEETPIQGKNGTEYVLYEDFQTLWTDSRKTAPTKDGFVFAGWCKKEPEDTFTLLTSETAKGETSAYAKFVPSYVLSIRAQLEKNTETSNGEEEATSTYLRVITSVPSNDYTVGFELFYNKTIAGQDSETHKLYSSIKNTETVNESVTPEEVFGAASDLFAVLRIKGISKANYKKVIYVRPYWVTPDGTRVEGQAKYVRVMDGYASNHYISVPVNLLAGGDVAAGTLEMSYDNASLEYVGAKNGWDTGLLLPEMDIHVDEAKGVIKLVGNTVVGANNSLKNVSVTDDIYANVWFKRKSDATMPSEWNFTIEQEKFCDWSETIITNVSAWDVNYKEQE